MINSDVFSRLAKYWQAMANSFEDKKIASEIFPNKVDSGSEREDIFMEFLKEHIPTRCKVIKGGFIFDSNGHESKQIDLIITNDLTLNFKNLSQYSGKSFAFIEGCYAVFSIKTKLTKESLIDSLDNLDSIPPMPPMQINPALSNTEKANRIPHRFIFAFDGLDYKTIGGHLSEYYAQNHISQTKTVDYIIVNNKYIIQKNGHKELELQKGVIVQPFSYFPNIGPNIGGFSLWVILTAIQTLSNYGSQTLFNFKNYDNNLIKSMSDHSNNGK